jgi:hypothetical protein
MHPLLANFITKSKIIFGIVIAVLKDIFLKTYKL